MAGGDLRLARGNGRATQRRPGGNTGRLLNQDVHGLKFIDVAQMFQLCDFRQRNGPNAQTLIGQVSIKKRGTIVRLKYDGHPRQ